MNKKLAYSAGFCFVGLLIVLSALWANYRSQGSPESSQSSQPDTQSDAPLTQVDIIREINRLNALGHLKTLPIDTSLAFNYEAEHIIVPARLNDSAKRYPFILDSGVSAVVLDIELAESLGIEGHLPCDRDVTYCALETVEVGDATFAKVGTFIMSFSNDQNPIHCISGNGIL